MYGNNGGFNSGGWSPWTSGAGIGQQQGKRQQGQNQLRPGVGVGVGVQAQAQQYNPMAYQQQQPQLGVYQQLQTNTATAAMMSMAYGYSVSPNVNNFQTFQQQQQQNLYQQQQQQHANQSLFQTNMGNVSNMGNVPNMGNVSNMGMSAATRPLQHQPPLPPGPPPPPKEPSSIFGNITPKLPPQQQAPQYHQPPLPPTPSPATPAPAVAPPLPPVPTPVPPPPPKDTTPVIPEAVLKLLQNAEVQRQIQLAAESSSSINPLMALNVSQELFGSSATVTATNKGIPGLDGETSKKPEVEEIVEEKEVNKKEEETKKDVDWNEIWQKKKEETKNTEKEKNQNPQQSGFSATIPLASKDGKPIEYDRRTLKAFDRKFRDWEKQFESWKAANQNHPDKDAYKKYMGQWNLWREQLIEQRRSIIDSMNTARLEANDVKFTIDEDGNLVNERSNKNKKSMELNSKLEPPFGNKARNSQNQNSAWNTDKPMIKTEKTPAAPPLMSLDIDIGNKPQISGPNASLFSTQTNNQQRQQQPKQNERDRPVERILRDRDRPGLGAKPSNANANASNQKSASSERISRDPQSENPFAVDEVTWELPHQKQNANPFDVASSQQQQEQQQRNPFVQAATIQNANPWTSSSSTERSALPTLSDFLNKDECKVTDDYLNRRDSNLQMQNEPGKMKNSTASTPRLEFEPTSKLLPLVKPKSPPRPLPQVVKEEEEEKELPNEISQWFTRDRGGGYEYNSQERKEPEAPFYEDNDDTDNAPAVIDYGHGSVPIANNEDDEFDIPRCERAAGDDYGYDDDEGSSNAVTIDYGHGSAFERPARRGLHDYPPQHYHGQEGYYEEQYPPHYPPEHPSNYYPPTHHGPGQRPPMRGRGRGGFFPRGRGGRGRGVPGYESHYEPSPRLFPIAPPRDYDQVPPAEREHRIRQAPPERDVGIPAENKGRGRGMPIRFGGVQNQAQDEYGTNAPARVRSPPLITDITGLDPIIPPPKGLMDEEIEMDEDWDVGRNGPRRNRDLDRITPDSSRSRRGDNSADRDRDRRRPPLRDIERDRERRNDDRRPRGRDESPISRRGDRDRESHSSRDRDRGRIRRSRSPVERLPIRRSPSTGAHANPPPPRYQTVLIEDILNQPGRAKRPSQIVIILRGLPGSGKSYVAKLIKDKEVVNGESAPKILSLDDYFVSETVKTVKDPLTRQEVTKVVHEYEYESDLEPRYRMDLIKTFKKNVTQGLFPFMIIDCVNDHVRHFEEIVSIATQKRFQVYIAEVEESVENCAKRNIHHRTKEQITKIHKNWERTPSSFVRLDIKTLLQDEAVQNVQMEDVSDSEEVILEEEVKTETPKIEVGKDKWEEEDVGNGESQFPETSKWEKIEPSEEKLNRLDGLARKRSGNDEDKVDPSSSVESWLQSHLPEDYTTRQQTRPGQKRVRWADIEERRTQERMRDIGFTVGTDWGRIQSGLTDPSFAASALTRTKYI